MATGTKSLIGAGLALVLTAGALALTGPASAGSPPPLPDLGLGRASTLKLTGGAARRGFSADLSAAQATALAKDPRVAAVTATQVLTADATTASSGSETGVADGPVTGAAALKKTAKAGPAPAYGKRVTHTASTAAGEPVAHAVIDGRDLGPIQGVAPDARVAVYKALWGGSGPDADIIAAIDAAVADGVQVINYSIGVGFGDFTPNSPIGNAFLNAYLAGVFVSASAGNDGFSGMISNGGSARVALSPPPVGEQWAYTEFRTGHDVVPGLLIDSE